MIVDLFAGPGGWSEGLRSIGLEEIGLEIDRDACSTRARAGHRTIRADVSTFPIRRDLRLEGLIGSPPCPAFSTAGKQDGREHLPELVDAVHRTDWTARPSDDPRVWLVLEVGRWIEETDPEWIALEQVPALEPVWHAYAQLLRDAGYSSWSGILNAADYGVPQIRKRAILVASRTRPTGPPARTHTGDESDSSTLFGTLEPWVTMADALGWTGAVGFPRVDDVGTSEDGFRERDWRPTSEPSFALTEKARSWTYRRPATTIAGDPRVFHPGSHAANDGRNLDHAIGRSEHTIRVEIEDALVLQSFRRDYPVSGSKTSKFLQIGNAIPPRMAAKILENIVT